MAGYSRDLTLDSGVILGAGHDGRGLQCDVGGGTAAYTAGNYIGNGSQFSCFAWVKSLSSTPGLRVIAENRRTGDRVQTFLLSDASGNLAAVVGLGGISSTVRSSGVSVLDGAWHHVGVAYDAITTGNLTFWVDGTVVSTTTLGTGNEAEYDGSFAIGRATTSASTNRANAIIDELRWFNDPVYTSEAYLFSAPVTNLVTAAYSFSEPSGSAVVDSTLRHNDIALTANGSRAAAKNGNGLYSTSGHGAEGDVTLWPGGTFDRLSVCGWVKVTTTGSAAPFLSLEDSSGNPKFQLFRGSALGLLVKVWGDSGTAPYDGSYAFTEDAALSTSEWRFFYFNANPTGLQAYVCDSTGARLSVGGFVSSGGLPTNLPIISGVSKVRLGGGIAALDDVRIIRNYLNGPAVGALSQQPVIQEPGPILADSPVGSLSLGGTGVAAVRLARSAAGGLTLSGGGSVATARTAAGSLSLAGSSVWSPREFRTAVGGPALSGSTKSEQGSGPRTALGALSLTGQSTVLVFASTVATTAVGGLSLAGSSVVVAPVAVSALGSLSLSVAVEWARIGGQGYVLVVRGRQVRLGAVADVPAPFRLMTAEVPQSLVKVGGLYRLVDETDEDMIAQAERVYLGGRRYVVDDVARAELIQAGYGDWLSS